VAHGIELSLLEIEPQLALGDATCRVAWSLACSHPATNEPPVGLWLDASLTEKHAAILASEQQIGASLGVDAA